MDGSSIAQIAGEDDFEAIKSTVGLSNGEQVKHGLRGVVASAVSTVKDGDPCSVLCVLCSTLPWVAHRNDVGVAVHHLDGIKQRFAFDHGGCLDITEVHNIAAQALHGRFKRHASSGTGFKKQVSENFPLEQREVMLAFGHGQQALCIVKDAQDVFVGQVVHGNESRHGVPSVENTTR